MDRETLCRLLDEDGSASDVSLLKLARLRYELLREKRRAAAEDHADAPSLDEEMAALAAGHAALSERVPSETSAGRAERIDGLAAAPGAQLGGRFRLLERLGHGGMAEVWLARDEHLQMDVAVKLLLPHLTDRDDLRERFLGEARAALTLTHPDIVRVHHVDLDQGRQYMVMELLHGESLAAFMGRQPGRRLERGAAIELVAQLCEPLAYAHAAGVVHRDIKPANLWVDAKTGRCKVIDFGIARLDQGHGLTVSGQRLGTLRYMAPEQLEGSRVDARVDQWALGCVLIELLTGGSVQSGHPLRALPSDMPARLERVVRRAVAHDPDDRFDSVADLAAALQAGREIGDTELPPTWGDALPRTAKDRGVSAAARTPGHVSRGRKGLVALVVVALSIGGSWAAGMFDEVVPVEVRKPSAVGEVGTPAEDLLAAPPGAATVPDRRDGVPPGGDPGAAGGSDSAAITAPDWADVLIQAPVLEGLDAVTAYAAGNAGLPWRVRDRRSGVELQLVPAGGFMQGTRTGGGGKTWREEFPHFVDVTRPFYVGVGEITNAQFRRFRSEHDSGRYGGESLDGDDRPACRVTWHDAVAYCRHFGFRLPSEAEWEFMARAGADVERAAVYPWGEDGADAARFANLVGDGDGYASASPVGRFPPTVLGLHDVLGNAGEWCGDWYAADLMSLYGGGDDAVDPAGPATGTERVWRGGSWLSAARASRLSSRGHAGPGSALANVGFRVVRDV